jgi:hypothetical protein
VTQRLWLLLTLVFCAVEAQQADSLNCRLIGRFPNPLPVHLGYNDFAVAAGFAYMASSSDTMYVINVKNPALPTLAAKFSDGLPTYCVDVDGDYAYLAGGSTMRVIDISDSLSPSELGTCVISGSGEGITKLGNYAYVGAWSGGFDVIDVSNPASPTLVGHCATRHLARTVAISGSFAYVADQESGLCVVDVSNKAAPVVVGAAPSTAPGALSEGVDTVSGTNHVVDLDGLMLRVIDVSAPASPSVIGVCNTVGHAQSVNVVGERAYLAEDTRGLRVVDISNPTDPQEAGHWYAAGDTASGATAVVKNYNDSYTYVLDWYAGLLILQFYGDVGIDEGRRPPARSSQLTATIVRGVLFLTGDERRETGDRASLLDALGRRVMELQTGPNDVRHLSPGVYFITGPKLVQKVLLAR